DVDDALLVFSGNVAVRHRFGSGQETLRLHRHARLEARHPVDRLRGRVAAAEEVQRHAVRIEAGDDGDVTRRLVRDRVDDDVGREIDAVQADAAALNGLHVRLALLVIAPGLPAVEEALANLVLEAARQGRRFRRLGRVRAERDILGRADAAELHGLDAVVRHRLLNGRRQERVAAVDRERAVEEQARRIREQTAEVLLRVLRLAVQNLAIQGETVAEVPLDVAEVVLSAGVGRDLVGVYSALDPGAAVDRRAA